MTTPEEPSFRPSETDSMYDCIAGVVENHYPICDAEGDPTDLCHCGLPRTHVADLVISALEIEQGLRRTFRFQSGVPVAYSYVTDWIAYE